MLSKGTILKCLTTKTTAYRKRLDVKTDLWSKVVSSQGDEVYFKIKRSTELSKPQGSYANKVGKDVGSIRYVVFFGLMLCISC